MAKATSRITVKEGLTGKTHIRAAPNSPPKKLAKAPADDTEFLDHVHEALNDVSSIVELMSKDLYSSPFVSGLYYKDVQFVNGTSTRLAHGLQSKVRYVMYNVRDANMNVFRPASNEADVNILLLTPGATFRADVFIFPEP